MLPGAPYPLYKRALVAGLAAALYGVLAWWFNYHNVPELFPGYQVLALPGMLMLGLFSEELPFAPQAVLFLTGQFMAGLVLAWLIGLTRRLRTKPAI